MPDISGPNIRLRMRRNGSAVWTRLQNGNRSRCLVDLIETDYLSFTDMVEVVAQPALQQVGRPLSLIPVGLYVPRTPTPSS
jgi:hypothetical protein